MQKVIWTPLIQIEPDFFTILYIRMNNNASTESEKTVSITGTEMALFKIGFPSKDISELPNDESSTYSEIRSLDVSMNQFSTLDFVDQCPNLVDLDISENQISGGLDHLSKLSFLAYINFSKLFIFDHFKINTFKEIIF